MTGRTRKALSHLADEWDGRLRAELSDAALLRTQLVEATPDDEDVSERERRQRQELVMCSRCGLDVPRTTAIGVLALRPKSRAFYLCCWDCMGRWATRQAGLPLAAEISGRHPYPAILEMLHTVELTHSELEVIALTCINRQRKLDIGEDDLESLE